MERNFLLTACQSDGPMKLSYQFITFTAAMPALKADLLHLQIHCPKQPVMFLEAKAIQAHTLNV